ncbi:MAG: Alpha/beta hydrolase family protein [Methanoregula sp. PtaU1.Bin051]|nr:MAG: Alpha/beta hydrolase family protein [Methanoregula sp. PtaU1.Bin051]
MRVQPSPVPAFFILLLIAGICLAGCTGKRSEPAYSVDSSGKLSVSCPVATVSEDVLVKNETYTKSRIVFHTQDGDVVTYLSAPEKPLVAVVYVPGAGETVAAHGERMLRYAKAGYAFLYVDIRGNGGGTAGLPFGQQLIQSDYAKFGAGRWPQYYETICDLSEARRYLADRYNVPVYAMGSSNGGRYAVIAAATDPAFAGYIGISTSDWGLYDSITAQDITGDPVRFAASVEPSTYIASISPRPVWILHSHSDTIIPFDSGKDLYELAGEPKALIEFAGAHGINSDADDRILSEWAQIYGTRG